MHRRHFIKTAAAAGAASILSSPLTVLAKGSPARKITVAIMGLRSRGSDLARAFASRPDCEVSWLCDADNRYFAPCLERMAAFQDKQPKQEKDIRKVLEDKDLDALAIAAPDHWHAPAALMALEAGKHVYVEKPCSHNPYEGELLVAAQQKYKRVIQMGNQRRSWSNVIQAIRDVQEGLIGRVYFAKGWYANTRGPIGFGKQTEVPDYLDFDLWQGPAPRLPYRDNIHPYNWHWFRHWGTGEALNNGTHEIDVMRWGLGVEFPTRVVSGGGRYHYQDDWEFADTQVITCDFEGGKSLTWEGRSCNGRPIEGGGRGVIFYGTEGTLVMPGGNAYTVYGPKQEVVKQVVDESPTDKINTMGPGLALDAGHVEDFLSSIREARRPRSPIDEGHKSVLIPQLGNIAYFSGRELNIDQRNGHIVGDPEAMKLWKREYAAGWEL